MKIKIKPKDLCYCQSGKQYRFCHMARDNYKPDKRLIFDKKKYINEWLTDSNYFLEKGYYIWMANCLFEKINPETVLDIGCGNGNGIIELLKNNNIKNIISVEENEYCIDSAYEKLNEKGISVKVIKRNEFGYSKDGLFATNYTEINDFEFAKVNIIQGDIKHDNILKEYLMRLKFDAVTCWLIGTHESVNYNIDYIQAGVNDNKTFRLAVQNCIYEFVDKILRPKGFLHIVDRGEIPHSNEIIEQFIGCHKEQASVTNLKVDENIKYIEYEPIDNGIRMIESLYKRDTLKSEFKGFAFVSIFSMK